MTKTDQPPQTDAQQPIINIAGEKVALGPLRRDLLPLYLKWINDFEVLRFLAASMRPMSLEAEEEWYSQASKAENQAGFTIYEKARLRPIGNTTLGKINHVHRTAEFAIMIGDNESWGRGYGTEVTRLMLDYGFTCLGLHNIYLWVYAMNERGIRAYQRAGFQIAGRLRQSLRLGGQAYDNLLMECLATEFEGSTLSHLLPELSEAKE